MRKWLVVLASTLVFFYLIPVTLCMADVEWKVTKALKFDTTPLDLANSPDGKRIFVLAEGGKLLIYKSDGTLIDTLKVDPAMDRIAVSGEHTNPLENKIHLSSKTKKTAQQIVVAFRADINLAGAPYLGLPDAPVSIVVFSDFQ